jgi:hypothetical protein
MTVFFWPSIYNPFPAYEKNQPKALQLPII